MIKRSGTQKLFDGLTFPLRAITLFHGSRQFGMTSLAHERFDYVRREVKGHTLDVGCGRNNEFVVGFLNGNGRGIDVFQYEGLTTEHVVEDITHFPFEDGSFDSVTFIANLNHVPEQLRDIELAEAFRCLRQGGNAVVTMGNPLAELLVHRVVSLHDRVRGTDHDMDSERGMEDDEAYYLPNSEIKRRLQLAGFSEIRTRYFWTQWGLNHLLTARKR